MSAELQSVDRTEFNLHCDDSSSVSRWIQGRGFVFLYIFGCEGISLSNYERLLFICSLTPDSRALFESHILYFVWQTSDKLSVVCGPISKQISQRRGWECRNISSCRWIISQKWVRIPLNAATVSKLRGLFFFCPIPSLFISRGVLDGRRGTESQIFRSGFSSRTHLSLAKLVIAPLCFLKTEQKSHGPGPSPGEAGSGPICQSFPSSLFIDGRTGGQAGRAVAAAVAGGSNVLAPSSSPHECFLFGCCHWEKTHKYSLCISSHTLCVSHTRCGRGDVLSRAENLPRSVFICW